MSKLINETGNKYGYLTVIERGLNTKSGKAQWICKCDCGSDNIIVLGSSLRNGTTKSCGCYQKEQTVKASIVDLTGKTIGNFLVLESSGAGVGGHTWHCKCLLCGNEDVYIVTPNLTKQYSCGCSISSKGERRIKEILDKNNIVYIQEKRFTDCCFENGRQARFDFFLPDYNCIIEYDGRQHYKKGNGVFDNPEKFALTKEHDRIKNEYCKNKNIHLIRIPYTLFDKITLEMLLPETSSYLI